MNLMVYHMFFSLFLFMFSDLHHWRWSTLPSEYDGYWESYLLCKQHILVSADLKHSRRQ